MPVESTRLKYGLFCRIGGCTKPVLGRKKLFKEDKRDVPYALGRHATLRRNVVS
jgi:hypothetical protein